jgi:hypothetical protein
MNYFNHLNVTARPMDEAAIEMELRFKRRRVDALGPDEDIELPQAELNEGERHQAMARERLRRQRR